MKHAVICLALILGCGCAGTSRVARCYDGVRVAFPVKQKTTWRGYVRHKTFTDGGTSMFQIVGADGRVIDVYIDRRIGKAKTRGDIYLKAYPGDSGSIHVTDQAGFKRDVLKGMLF